jgi:hypothetical protein
MKSVIEIVESCGFRYDIRNNAFVSTTVPGLIAIASECTEKKMRMIKMCQCGMVLTIETDIPGITKKTCFSCGTGITIQTNKKIGGNHEEEDGTEKESTISEEGYQRADKKRECDSCREKHSRPREKRSGLSNRTYKK